MFSIFAKGIKNNAFGYKNGLPWKKIKKDLDFFKNTTINFNKNENLNLVLMGRKTFESLGFYLKSRTNIVVSKEDRNLEINNNLQFIPNLNMSSLKYLQNKYNPGSLFFIGGAEIIKESTKYIDGYMMTRINGDFEYDRSISFDENVNNEFVKKVSKTYFCPNNSTTFDFVIGDKHFNEIFKKLNLEIHEEYQYLKLIKKVLDTGFKDNNTYSLHGVQMKFDLQQSFPLLTTKKMYWKGIVEELLWFLKGHTSNKLLVENGVNFWTPNAIKKNYNNDIDDLGPVYGFQWRHFGAEYKGKNIKYQDGVDQLQYVINELKHNPTSRRIIMTSWNPCDISKMSLPPCHILVQFLVRDNKLDTILYQRSGDLGLGIPFNISSYSLLTYILCNICNLSPGTFTHFIGDCHIYNDHKDALLEQYSRLPYPFPLVNIKKKLSNIDDISNLSYNDIQLNHYNYHKHIYMSLIV